VLARIPSKIAERPPCHRARRQRQETRAVEMVKGAKGKRLTYRASDRT
jgi:hypothetical protein